MIAVIAIALAVAYLVCHLYQFRRCPYRSAGYDATILGNCRCFDNNYIQFFIGPVLGVEPLRPLIDATLKD